MPRLGDFEAWIEVEGARLPEFRMERDETTQTVRCWVPSEVGKNFAVKWKDYTDSHLTCGFVSTDGYSSHGIFLRPGKHNASVMGHPITSTTYNLFRFSSITLTDDETAAAVDEQTVKALGTIELAVQEGVEGDLIPYTAPKPAPSIKPLHEKLKKAGGHRVESGGEVSKTVDWRKFTWNGAPPHKFIFQYRPKDMLQALDIMPREAPPADRSADEDGHEEEPEASDAETLDGDHGNAVQVEIQELERRLSDLRQRNKRTSVKVETMDGPRKRVKREAVKREAVKRVGHLPVMKLST